MKSATKAAENSYYKARMAAAEFNDNLKSREGASEIVGIERTRLARIELGSLTPYPEEALMMADVYNAPELLNYYCTTDCPIGRKNAIKAEAKNIEQVAVRAYMSLKNANAIRDTIMEIAEDGVIDESEKRKLDEVMAMLTEIVRVSEELKIAVKKLEARRS